MAHALRGNLGRHPGVHHNAQPEGWWKFALVALVATAVGVAFVYSPLLRGSNRTLPRAPSPSIDFTLEVRAIAELVSVEPAAVTAAAPAVEPTQATVGNEASQLPAAPHTTVLSQPGTDIRNIDFAALPILQTLARQLAGRVDKAQITYADVTGDGNEDAIVPITSDGTYGNLAYVVFWERAGIPEPILTQLAGRERRGLILTFDRGQLAETSGIYGPNDANCCPGLIVKTYYRWEGHALAFDRMETITIPKGPKAD